MEIVSSDNRVLPAISDTTTSERDTPCSYVSENSTAPWKPVYPLSEQRSCYQASSSLRNNSVSRKFQRFVYVRPGFYLRVVVSPGTPIEGDAVTVAAGLSAAFSEGTEEGTQCKFRCLEGIAP